MNSIGELVSRELTVQVHSRGKTIPIEEDGYVGRLIGKATLELVVKLNIWSRNRGGILVFSKDGKHNVVLKKDLAQPPEDGRRYQAKMTLRKNSDLVSYTEHPQNTIGIAEITSDGKVTIHYVALISQNGDFFVTVQEMYKGQCYYAVENGYSVCGFAKWPQLAELVKAACLKMKLEEILASPPTATEREKEPEPLAADLPQNVGRVLWFDASSGVGAVIIHNDVARVHWSQITRSDRRKFLLVGEYVSFTTIDPIDSSDTTFKIEVRDIDVIDPSSLNVTN